VINTVRDIFKTPEYNCTKTICRNLT